MRVQTEPNKERESQNAFSCFLMGGKTVFDRNWYEGSHLSNVTVKRICFDSLSGAKISNLVE